MPAVGKIGLLGSLILCLSLPPEASVRAQTAPLLLTSREAFTETWLDAPPARRGAIVGSSIVGLRLDPASGAFDPEAVSVVIGDVPKGQDVLCVAMISRDGRYAAHAAYRLQANARGATPLETHTRFARQLSDYGAADMAVSARSARDCNDAKASVLHATGRNGEPARRLVVQLEAGDARIRAQLGQSNRAVSDPVVCAPVTQTASVGFTHECRVDLPRDFKPGLYQLSIGETASTGEVVVRTSSVSLAPVDAAPSK